MLSAEQNSRKAQKTRLVFPHLRGISVYECKNILKIKTRRTNVGSNRNFQKLYRNHTCGRETFFSLILITMVKTYIENIVRRPGLKFFEIKKSRSRSGGTKFGCGEPKEDPSGYSKLLLGIPGAGAFVRSKPFWFQFSERPQVRSCRLLQF